MDSTSGGSSSSEAEATISSAPRTALPIRASPYASALSTFSNFSSAYNGTFSAVATTVQAGCLCNAAAIFDFNGQMQGRHSYAQDRTQLRNYASAIANATTVRGCDPGQTSLLDLDLGGCTTSTASPAAATSSSSSLLQAGSEATLSPSTPSPTGTSGAVRIGGVSSECCGSCSDARFCIPPTVKIFIGGRVQTFKASSHGVRLAYHQQDF